MPIPRRKQPLKDFRSLTGTPLQRAFRISKEAVNAGDRTVRMAVTSDAPILHWISGRGCAYVILDHAKKSINLERLQFGGAFLENHDPNRLLGRIRNGETDGKVLRVDGRFNSRGRADEVFLDVQEDLEHGDSPGTSAWFSIERIAEKPEAYIDEFPVIRATRWTLLECSIASVEADIRSGIGRTAPKPVNDDEEKNEDPVEEADETDAEEADEEEDEDDPPPPRKRKARREKPMTEAERIAAEQAATKAAREARRTEFQEEAEWFADTEEQKTAYRTLARTLAADPTKTVTDLHASILEQRSEAQTPVNTTPQAAVIVPGRRTQSLRVFKGEGGDLKAYRFMMGFLANAIHGQRGWNQSKSAPLILSAHRYAQEHGLLQAQRAEGQTEGDPEGGGFTVQEEWSPDTIALYEEFGVIRKYTKVEPMATETKTIRRREGGLSFRAAGEGQDVEVEKKKWGANKLVAKKWLCMGKFSTELSEDSAVNQADDLAFEMGLAAVRLEDDLGFLADGTGSSELETGYQGVLGIIPKFLSLKLVSGAAATPAQTAGLVIAHGVPTAAKHIPLVFGDLRLGSRLGDRSSLTISMSEHSSFAEDSIDLKGRIRNDFIAHDIGNAAAAAADRKAGPILALATDSWSDVTGDHLNTLMGRLPRFAGLTAVRFFCHQTFYFTVMRKILMASGGATPADLAGAGPFQFGGYPVEFCQNLQNVTP
jgi:hypothetical protein